MTDTPSTAREPGAEHPAQAVARALLALEFALGLGHEPGDLEELAGRPPHTVPPLPRRGDITGFEEARRT